MMMIHEVIARTGLTRKAIEYYIDQGLICPETQENGYREFSGNDVARLTSIAVYRKLGVSIPEIKAILSDSSTATLKKLAARCGHLVMVTNDVFADGVGYTGSMADYLKTLVK